MLDIDEVKGGEPVAELTEFENPKIYGAIANVIRDIGAVTKDQFNSQQRYKFRGIDDVYNALNPALAKNRVFIVPNILECTQTEVGKTKNGASIVRSLCKIEFTFFAEDGSNIKTVIYGEAFDMADKGINKAMSIAYKYACFQVFCIPTEEMADPDGETIEIAEAKEQKEAQEAKVTPAMVQTIRMQQERTGVTDSQILGRKAIKAKKIEDLTVVEFQHIMAIFEKTPDRKAE